MMTQMERLTARIQQLCKANPGTAMNLVIIVGANGEPVMWIPDLSWKMEGDDRSLIAAGIKPEVRKEAPP